ncbi:MAG: ABC transporter ATP-binding protein, partial [Rhodobacteraceae bacterium]|nr:ABC transporter ATP-binding protein [Paracoccaceae bacterium]
MAVLEVNNLRTVLHLPIGAVPVVNNVSFQLHAGETLGIVGESGCGKSMLALSLLGLQPNPPAEIAGGSAIFEGANLLDMHPGKLRNVRGRRIGMIFQDPLAALNPVMKVGDQIAEVLRRHLGSSRRAALRRAVELLELVRIPDPDRRAGEYPFQLSGGLRQRVMIAMALACDPAVLIADEPTTALDVTIQRQILELVRDLQRERGLAVLHITHDLGLIAEHADRVVVMYCGRIVEQAATGRILEESQHPYTCGLLNCAPTLGLNRNLRLSEIPGTVPPLDQTPPGCSFEPRCNRSIAICRTTVPKL